MVVSLIMGLMDLSHLTPLDQIESHETIQLPPGFVHRGIMVLHLVALIHYSFCSGYRSYSPYQLTKVLQEEEWTLVSSRWGSPFLLSHSDTNRLVGVTMLFNAYEFFFLENNILIYAGIGSQKTSPHICKLIV